MAVPTRDPDDEAGNEKARPDTSSGSADAAGRGSAFLEPGMFAIIGVGILIIAGIALVFTR
jgi:hypothetical protein